MGVGLMRKMKCRSIAAWRSMAMGIDALVMVYEMAMWSTVLL